MGDYPPRDSFGMTAEEWRWARWEFRREHARDRWKALKALWCKPVQSTSRSQYVDLARDKGDDWTIWRAICATIGVILDRNWCDVAEERLMARKGSRAYGLDMAYFDARSVYGGYEVTVLWLYPSCRVSIFSDGECLM